MLSRGLGGERASFTHLGAGCEVQAQTFTISGHDWKTERPDSGSLSRSSFPSFPVSSLNLLADPPLMCIGQVACSKRESRSHPYPPVCTNTFTIFPDEAVSY
jgi:hypothetical protein